MRSERDWRGLLFVAPFLLLYAIILIFPLFRGMWLSLEQVDLFGDGHFVGLGNYALLASDDIFVTSMLNTFELALEQIEDEVNAGTLSSSFVSAFTHEHDKLQRELGL